VEMIEKAESKWLLVSVLKVMYEFVKYIKIIYIFLKIIFNIIILK